MGGDGRGGAGRGGAGPAGRRAAGWRVDPDERRVLGLPLRWLGSQDGGERGALRHPAAYLRWRRERRRLGPYARSLAQVIAGSADPDA